MIQLLKTRKLASYLIVIGFFTANLFSPLSSNAAENTQTSNLESNLTIGHIASKYSKANVRIEASTRPNQINIDIAVTNDAITESEISAQVNQYTKIDNNSYFIHGISSERTQLTLNFYCSTDLIKRTGDATINGPQPEISNKTIVLLSEIPNLSYFVPTSDELTNLEKSRDGTLALVEKGNALKTVITLPKNADCASMIMSATLSVRANLQVSPNRSDQIELHKEIGVRFNPNSRNLSTVWINPGVSEGKPCNVLGNRATFDQRVLKCVDNKGKRIWSFIKVNQIHSSASPKPTNSSKSGTKSTGSNSDLCTLAAKNLLTELKYRFNSYQLQMAQAKAKRDKAVADAQRNADSTGKLQAAQDAKMFAESTYIKELTNLTVLSGNVKSDFLVTKKLCPQYSITLP